MIKDDIGLRVALASGLRSSLVPAGAREPFETPRTHPLIQAMERAGQQVGGRVPNVIGTGLVGDANIYVNEPGIPTLYFGLAHETAHSDDERVNVQQLASIAGMYALTATPGLATCNRTLSHPRL